MRLLLDTDAFCILAASGLLHDAVDLLGMDLAVCGRLPALPHMLRKGRLRRSFGDDVCDTLILIAHRIPKLEPPSDAWLDRLTLVYAIDPGEAQLFAAAAERGMMVISGDKRALGALKDVEEFVGALAGRIVVMEAMLLALCDRLGTEKVRRRVEPVMAVDTVVRVCFSSGNPNPAEALLSYYRDAVAAVAPLVLWEPPRGGGK
jgi:hypothetical protein